jgi:hypothetical protein
VWCWKLFWNFGLDGNNVWIRDGGYIGRVISTLRGLEVGKWVVRRGGRGGGKEGRSGE